jgi:hypothetical protein
MALVQTRVLKERKGEEGRGKEKQGATNVTCRGKDTRFPRCRIEDFDADDADDEDGQSLLGITERRGSCEAVV